MSLVLKKFPRNWIVGIALWAVAGKAVALSEKVTPESIILAEKGQARAVIVMDPELKNWREKLAVEDIAKYLRYTTGAIFPMITAGQEKPGETCIYLNRTAAGRLGLDQATLAGEEWVIRVRDGSLYLTGGERDGFLYAVYHFLEDQVGVRWWNAYEEEIPDRPTLTIPLLDRRGKPAFEYRQVGIPYNECEVGMKESMFALRNRTDYWFIPQKDGYIWQYHTRDRTMPFTHALLTCVTPEVFKEHPEWFAMVDGKRTLDARDLCLSNREVRAYASRKLIEAIGEARQHHRDLGSPEPYIVSFGREDCATWCQCPECTAYSNKYSKTDLLFDFVNSAAEAVGKIYPEVRLCVAAYQAASVPPKHVTLLPNVLVMYCTEGLNEARGLTDPSNAEVLSQINIWKSKTKNLYLYEYQKTFQRFQGGPSQDDFPCPGVWHYAQDLRWCRRMGLSGIYNELWNYPTQDMRDLKAWMLIKLMEDPNQDDNKLLITFLDGFYGPGASGVRRYLEALKRQEAIKPSRIWFFADLLEYRYLFDPGFLEKAGRILAEAEKSAGKDPYARRVREVRLSVDRAILFTWPRLMHDWAAEGHSVKNFPLDREGTLARYRKAFADIAMVRAGSGGQFPAAQMAIMNSELKIFEKNLFWDLPVPLRFAKVPKKKIYTFPAVSGVFELGDNARLIDDPQAALGKTIRVTGPEVKFPFSWKYQPTWGEAQAAGRSIASSQVPGPGYHWLDLGSYLFDSTNSGLVFFSNKTTTEINALGLSFGTGTQKVNFWGSGLEPGRYMVWASLKCEGPDLPFGRPGDHSAVSVDQMILIRDDSQVPTVHN